MFTNTSSTSLVIGMAAFGVSLIVAGARLYRRHRVGSAAERLQNNVQLEAGIRNNEESLSSGLPDKREAHKKTPSDASQGNKLLPYFLLIFVLSVPFWVIGATDLVALPEGKPLYLPNLLWHISMAILPMIVALILVYRERGSNGVKRLLKRPFAEIPAKGKIWWYVPIFLSFPLLMVLEYAWLQVTDVALPNLKFPGAMVPIFFVLFFALGIGEELGWSGYALGPLQDRWTALGASVFLGIASLVWHLVPLMEEPHSPMWIVWHAAAMIPLRVIMVWLYNNTGRSMFAVVAFHAMVNIGEVVWPFYGTTGYYDPFITFVLLTVMAAIVTFLWGPRTLARYRYASADRS